MASKAVTILRTSGSITIRRHFHQTTTTSSSSSHTQPAVDSNPNPNKDKPGSGGKVAGNTAPKPKISNLSVPGVDTSKGLTEEQKKEVMEHNRDFEKKFDHGSEAPHDKVDKHFWETSGKKG